MAGNVINCPCESTEIVAAVERVLSAEFREGAAKVGNPFGDGRAADRIVTKLLQTDFSAMHQKQFHDVEFELEPEDVLRLNTRRLSHA